MRLISTLGEELAIKTICSPRKEVAGTVLANVDADTFATEAAKEAYAFIQKYMNQKGEAPTFELLCTTPRLSEETREKLNEVTRVVRTIDSAEKLAESLADFRRKRAIYEMNKHTLEVMSKATVDVDELIKYLQDGVSKVAQKKSVEETIFHIGKDDSTLDIARSILFDERPAVFIPTGMKTWDSRSGGWLRKQATLLAGATGSGKSLVAGQIAMNQAAMGYKVVFVPLEMGVEETIARMMSNVSGIENKEIQFQRLTQAEKELVWSRWQRFQRRMAKKGGRLTIYKPQGGVTIQQTFAALHAYVFDVAYIDYVGLLDGVNGDKSEAQWLQMGNAIRYGKIYADQTDRAIVVLAQLSAEGRIRYSGAMEEHAATTWFFVATKESREAGNLKIEVTKGRNQEIFPFVLAIDYATQTLKDLAIESQDESSTSEEDSAQANSDANTKVKQSAKYLDDIV